MIEEEFTNNALLIWQEGDIIKEQWVLEAPKILIGRDPKCHIQLPSRWISRVHVCLHRNDDLFMAEDAGSKNGVFINGKRIYNPQILNDGDKLQLAPGLDLIFVDNEATAPLPGRDINLLYLDHNQRQVYVKGQLLLPALSSQQYKILAKLVEQPGRIYSRDEIIDAAWPKDDPGGVSDDAIDACIRRLRQRLENVNPTHEYIITVRGHGFKLNLE